MPYACNDMMDVDGDGIAGIAMNRSGEGLVDIDGDGVFDMQYGMKIDVVKGASVNPGGADGSKSMATPRPDGPQPTEQQINEGPYTGRHLGGWKMKRGLLEPVNVTDNGRHISMSNVHGVFFKEPNERWYEIHNNAEDSQPAEDFKMRLYPLDRDMYSPWEPTVKDKTPMSKTVGSFYDEKTASKGPGVKAEIGPAKYVPGSSFATSHIQGHQRPASKGVPPKGEVKQLVKTATLSDNPSWGKMREGDESQKKPDPSWGYTGHPFARRYDAGEEDLSMASRISRRRQQSIERRFSASPYAAHIAQDVLKLGDGIDPPDIGPYGWAAFPPLGLQPDADDVKGLASWEAKSQAGSRVDVDSHGGRSWAATEFD